MATRLSPVMSVSCSLVSYCTASERLCECTQKKGLLACIVVFMFSVSIQISLFADLQSDPVALLQRISKCCTPHTLSSVRIEDAKL